MSDRERELRLKLAELAEAAFVRGTINTRHKVCGKPTCRCTRGDRHEAVYLTASEKGKTKQLFIPKKLEQKTNEWVGAYQQIREILEELSKIYWNKLKRRKV